MPTSLKCVRSSVDSHAPRLTSPLFAQFGFELLLRVPSIKRKVTSQLDQATKDMQEQVAPRIPGRNRWLTLPENGKSAEWLVDEMDALKNIPASEWSKGRVSGAVYHGGEDMEKVIADAFAKFVISNPLHPDVFPGTPPLPHRDPRAKC